MDDLALHQGDVERAGFEPRHVLGAALGVDGFDIEPGIDAAHALNEGRPIDRKATARRCGAEADLHGLSLRRQRRQGGGANKEASAMGHGMSVAVVAAMDFDRDVAQMRKPGQTTLIGLDRQRRIRDQ